MKREPNKPSSERYENAYTRVFGYEQLKNGG
jgi:hypothetical protein